jgi:hypothetical protein
MQSPKIDGVPAGPASKAWPAMKCSTPIWGLPQVEFPAPEFTIFAKKVSRIYEFWNVASFPR